MKRRGLINFGVFCGVILAFFVALVLVYIPANQHIERRMPTTNLVWQQEGNYPVLNTRDAASRLDNFTDKLMIGEAVKAKSDPVYAAMDSNGYARYWHGYLLWLRPMLMVMSYGSVREIYAVVLLVLVALNLYLMAKRLDLFASLAFAVALAFQRFMSISISMQFANVFIIMLLANCLILVKRDDQFVKWHPFLFFLITGAVTNYVDLLTAPLITLGVPLCLVLYREFHRHDRPNFGSQLLLSLVSGIAWTLGYGVTWLAKWLIASLVTGRNVVQEALTEILFRSAGKGRNNQFPVDRGQMFKNNFNFEFSTANKLMLLMIVVISLIALVWFWCQNGFKLPYQTVVIMALVCTLPYVWYFVLANHSQIHSWFTYREQMIAVFAFLLADAAALYAAMTPVDRLDYSH